MDVRSITPLILTFDEAPNIARTLDKLFWASRIVVVDSGSTDGTLSILQRYRAVEVFHRAFDDFAAQLNFGLTKVESSWVLALDADYEISDELIDELENLTPTDRIAGYDAKFIYRVFGRALRGSLYPPHTVLYRRFLGSYRNEGHAYRLSIEGKTEVLSGRIFHDDRKPLTRWFASQQRYAGLEAHYLLTKPRDELRRSERIRLVGWLAPGLVFLHTLFIKRCVFDGWPGWFYVLQRSLAEIMIAIEIIDRKHRFLSG
jgi:glycosyltransferase involved in cell wall biosynthesis